MLYRPSRPAVPVEPSADIRPEPPAGQLKVWDLAVRLFHWTLAGVTLAALATGLAAPRSWLDAHVVLGVAAAALVAFRLVWGMVGPTYARFASFPPDPRRALAYARAMLRGATPHYIGHNPLGAMMVATLLLVIAALTVTGTIMLGGLAKEGPLAALASFGAGATAGSLHEALGWLILVLAALHTVGVVVEGRREGQSLVLGMVTGRKAAVPDAVTAPERPARPRLAAAILAVAAAVLVPMIVLASRQPAAGVPTQPLDPLYVRECGSCHAPHHPSLAPAATWAGIIDGLASHFGDDASLSPDDTARLAGYLAANAAERFDTKAANLLRQQSQDAPLRITRTPGWMRLHRALPPAAFTPRAVGGALNCTACHTDATSGRFAARAISLPQETK